MAGWTTPRTWPTTGYIVTAPDLNEQIRDNMNAVHGSLITTAATYGVQTSDGQNVTVAANASGAPIVIGLYTAIGNTGAHITVRKIDASVNAVTVDPAGSQTIDGNTTWALATQHDYVTMVSNGSDWLVVADHRAMRPVTCTAAYSVLATDEMVEAGDGTFTVTLHAAGVVRRTRPLIVTKRGTGTTTIAAAGSDTIIGAATIDLILYDALMLIPDAAGTGWIVN